MSMMADFYLHSEIKRFSSLRKSISVELNVSINSIDTCTFSSIPFSLLLTILGTSSSLTTYCLSLPKSLVLATWGTWLILDTTLSRFLKSLKDYIQSQFSSYSFSGLSTWLMFLKFIMFSQMYLGGRGFSLGKAYILISVYAFSAQAFIVDNKTIMFLYFCSFSVDLCLSFSLMQSALSNDMTVLLQMLRFLQVTARAQQMLISIQGCLARQVQVKLFKASNKTSRAVEQLFNQRQTMPALQQEVEHLLPLSLAALRKQAKDLFGWFKKLKQFAVQKYMLDNYRELGPQMTSIWLIKTQIISIALRISSCDTAATADMRLSFFSTKSRFQELLARPSSGMGRFQMLFKNGILCWMQAFKTSRALLKSLQQIQVRVNKTTEAPYSSSFWNDGEVQQNFFSCYSNLLAASAAQQYLPSANNQNISPLIPNFSLLWFLILSATLMHLERWETQSIFWCYGLQYPTSKHLPHRNQAFLPQRLQWVPRTYWEMGLSFSGYWSVIIYCFG